jgi:hypothetical protein
MNLQTEALAKQAAEYAIEFATQDQALYIPKLMEKFAELIVRDCIVDFYRRQLGIPDSHKREDITIQVEQYVKEHFGVNE